MGVDAGLRVTEGVVFVADPGPLRLPSVNPSRNVDEHAGSGVTVGMGKADTGFCVDDDVVGIEKRTTPVFEPGKSGDENGGGLGLCVVQPVADIHRWGVGITDGNRSGACLKITRVDVPEGGRGTLCHSAVGVSRPR